MRVEQSFSDHLLVAYRVNADAKRSVFFPPKVRMLSEREKNKVAAKFAQSWHGHDFAQALEQDDTNLAWTMLSDVAEIALASGEEAEGHRRSLAWEPQQGEQQSHKPTKNGHESDSLRLLRRISAQLRQFKIQPHVGGSLGDLQKCVEFLMICRSFRWKLDEIDPVIEWIERLIEDLSVQEREAVIHLAGAHGFQSSDCFKLGQAESARGSQCRGP